MTRYPRGIDSMLLGLLREDALEAEFLDQYCVKAVAKMYEITKKNKSNKLRCSSEYIQITKPNLPRFPLTFWDKEQVGIKEKGMNHLRSSCVPPR